MARLVPVEDPADPQLADYRDLRDVQLRSHLEVEHGTPVLSHWNVTEAEPDGRRAA